MKRDGRGADGLSMIELIVVVVLVGIMGIVVATILSNSWQAQGDVTTTTRATNEGQLVGQSIERAVRNGLCMDAPDSRTLQVHTGYPTGDTRVYQQFWIAPDPIDSSKSALYMANSASTTLPSPSPWATGVAMVPGSSAYFVLSADRKSVTYSINLTTDAAPVTISGSASLRAPGGPTPCWS